MLKPARGKKVAARMYCQGFGDCHLLAFANGAKPFYVVIDCGVVFKTDDERERMIAVTKSLLADTGGHIDVLIITHEHYDHLCGFNHAKETWKDFDVKELWLPWTEKKDDPLATKIDKYRDIAIPLAQGMMARMPMGENSDRTRTLLEFLPAYTKSTGVAMSFVKNSLPKAKVSYLFPGDQQKIGKFTAIALGPPHVEAKLKDLEGASGDTFGHLTALAEAFGLDALPAAPDYEGRLRQALGLGSNPGKDQPFDRAFCFSATDSRWDKLDEVYGKGRDSRPSSLRDSYFKNDWRRIDDIGGQSLERLALQLDKLTNNLSLALAFVIDEDTVLLYPGDAQIGNWKSWGMDESDAPVTFEVHGKHLTIQDILSRVKLYKAGHHASHNGTWTGALDQMPKEEMITFVPQEPVSQWPSIPQPDLVAELRKRGSFVISKDADRADKDFTWSKENLPNSTRPLWVQVQI